MKLLAYIFILQFTICSAFSQNNQTNRKEKLKAMKVAFITEKLDLSSDEAQKFWPVYNEYDKAREELMKDRKSLMKSCKDETTVLTDKEAEELADNFIKHETDEAKLMEEYHTKFKKVLSSQKLIKLYQAERQFKNHLLKQLGQGGGHRGPGPHNGPPTEDEE
ncbi:MAG: hypothetical protein A2033_14995 [Bacteroidetes bacterium GWA2_31_9]|nr:MAG: hypothetical protein A2033_14995 [Bacteroidetes bacterium GWA2_31_9]